jgi:hypothetical protein
MVLVKFFCARVEVFDSGEKMAQEKRNSTFKARSSWFIVRSAMVGIYFFIRRTPKCLVYSYHTIKYLSSKIRLDYGFGEDSVVKDGRSGGWPGAIFKLFLGNRRKSFKWAFGFGKEKKGKEEVEPPRPPRAPREEGEERNNLKN